MSKPLFLHPEQKDIFEDLRFYKNSIIDEHGFREYLHQFRLYLYVCVGLPYRLAFYALLEKDVVSMARKIDWQILSTKLTEKQKKEFLSWAEKNSDDLDSIVDSQLAGDHKISISWVDSSNAYCVSLSGKEDSKNHKKTITSWSDDVLEALAMSAYKVTVVFGNGEWHDTVENSSWG